jgi:predicted ribosome quality control (RQC) complex YloA/Tae2 family protein
MASSTTASSTMQQLDAITLKHLATELQSLLDNAKVSKVQHPSAHEFLITFWGGPARPDNLNLFYIQLNPEAPFCALTHPKHRQQTALHTFSKPTALCMLLRKHLNGASLQVIRTLPGERVLDLVFENFNELGNRVRLVLSLELMGKHSNMIFYDEVQGTILAVAHGVSELMSSYRELAAGLPYAPPPRQQEKRLLSEMTQAEFVQLWQQKPPEENASRFLNGHLAGFGQRMLDDVLQVVSQTGTVEPIQLYQNLLQLEQGKQIVPAISPSRQQFTLVPEIAEQPDWQPTENVNHLVTHYFIGHLQESRLKRRRQQLTLQLEQQEKKLKRREAELVPIRDEEINVLQDIGDRLLAAMSAKEVPEHPTAHKGSVALTHYETGEPWIIEIDPTCGWVENAQIYYRRAKKAKARKDAYQQMATSLQNEREYLSNLRLMVDQADTLAELDAIEVDMAEAGFGKKAGKMQESQNRKKQTEETPGVVSLRSSDGLEILLGKSGQGNDALVGKLSRSDDLWLHVHQMPGSHVLVRSGKGEIPDQTLLEAATLAAYYSSARQSANVPVVYTQSKYVRKIPQSYPGHVNYRQEKTVFITPDEVLLERLLATITN